VKRASTQIREAARQDVEELVALAQAGRGDTEMRDRVDLDLQAPNRRLFVAVAESQVVGYGRVAYFEPPDNPPANVAPAGYYLSGLLVSEAWRRHGLGERLTGARLSWIYRRASEAWYFTNARNRASLALHAKLGFVEITRDFIYPGITFEGGSGVLSRASSSVLDRLEPQGD
jgi:ribosomal protein S18 acetylase RimI-like enzyme